MEPGNHRVETIHGYVEFDYPLVIPAGGFENSDRNFQWKYDLNSFYGLSGESLTNALISDGYDGIISLNSIYLGKPQRKITEISEIVDIGNKFIER